MEWKKIDERIRVRDQVPHDKPFIALWKGAIVFLEWNDEGKFYMCMGPSTYPMTGAIDRDREGKITHFMELQRPEDY